jgi:ABC-type antimicrobial peptide transport system permease subunit
MRFHRTFVTAVRALRRNKTRAMLTMLGIIIGIAAVITMMEIGKGSADAIQTTLSSMGAATLMVLPGTAASGGVSFGAGSVMTLTPDDCDAIIRDCPAVKAAAPLVRARAQVVYQNRNWVPDDVYGTTPDYLVVRDWPLAEGESFTDRDVRNTNKVCLLGQTIVRELFQGEDPVGKQVRVRNISFKVIGVLKSKGANMVGMDQDDILLAPWTTIKFRVTGFSATTVNQSSATSSTVNTLSQLYPSTQVNLYPVPSASQQADQPLPVRFSNVDRIIASAKSPTDMSRAINEMSVLLRERHHIQPGESDDFNVRDMTEITSALTSTATMMSRLLLSVALISLAVGGIGIMNIMLVSVTERTREIGLRMAVGARGWDILRQFLFEAVFLCLIGGTIGILLGRLASYAVKAILHWPTELSIEAIVAAVAVSITVGIVFGFYPAWKAARLDPIEALRYE